MVNYQNIFFIIPSRRRYPGKDFKKLVQNILKYSSVLHNMPDETRVPVNAKIPKSLHDSLLTAVEEEKYKDRTACITEALEKLLNNTEQETSSATEILQNKEIEIQNYKNELQEKYTEIQRLQRIIQEAPDPVEMARLQAGYDELQKHNLTLKEELNKASQDKEDLKNTYNNYFVQVQSLINQKALEAPGEKRRWWRFW